MKNRAMKKHIPYGSYCHGPISSIKDGHPEYRNMCQYWKSCGTTIIHRNYEKAKEIAGSQYFAKECEYKDSCTRECWTSSETSCQSTTIHCRYMNFIDENGDTMLSDQCKMCGVHDV